MEATGRSVRTMLMGALLLTAFSALAVAPAQANGHDGVDCTTDPAQAPPVDVVVESEIAGFTDRSTLTPVTVISPGQTVQWVIVDGVFHTVTAGPFGGAFDSGAMSPGTTFICTFNGPGVYEYFCAFHPGTMRGAVVVA